MLRKKVLVYKLAGRGMPASMPHGVEGAWIGRMTNSVENPQSMKTQIPMNNITQLHMCLSN